jgi:hypothetical protein
MARITSQKEWRIAYKSLYPEIYYHAYKVTYKNYKNDHITPIPRSVNEPHTICLCQLFNTTQDGVFAV